MTSEEIRSSRFQGTRHVYDRREVDAFLHRAASTLEIYERKLTVTESHVENLEKALDLAQSRARSMGGLDARVAELEAALAASQHNYESAMSELEARAESESSQHSLAKSERELRVKIEAADALKAQAAAAAETIENDARASADSAVSAARTEAEEILRTALLAQTSIIEEVEQMRLKAEADVEAKLDELRSQQEPATEPATGQEDAQAKAELKEANQRASAAEAKAAEVKEDLERLREELAARPDVPSVPPADPANNAEVDEMRRQVAQMRTALANIQERFAGAAKLSPEELELATALVDLDLHDVDLLVDLTSSPMSNPRKPTTAQEPPPAERDHDAEPRVTVKSKWAQAEAVPAGALTEGRSEVEAANRVWPEVEEPTPNWRDSFGSARKEAAQKAAAQAQAEEPLGFYERRLAGLRDRIRDAGGDKPPKGSGDA